MFSCEICEVLNNSFFIEHFWPTSSVDIKNCSCKKRLIFKLVLKCEDETLIH